MKQIPHQDPTLSSNPLLEDNSQKSLALNNPQDSHSSLSSLTDIAPLPRPLSATCAPAISKVEKKKGIKSKKASAFTVDLPEESEVSTDDSEAGKEEENLLVTFSQQVKEIITTETKRVRKSSKHF